MIQEQINQLPLNQDQKDKYLKSLVYVPVSAGFMWLQDPFQPFINKNNGKNYYKRGGKLLTGHGAGNIEVLPDGTCLVGDDHFFKEKDWTTYVDQFCPKDKTQRIKVPTRWLLV
ncbi:MAG: hypothetical protein NZ480_06095 [Bdellovibrionaceae bacterium]|nr:hypothetical protein [Pseudobdellovibrionaceae bacterium]MDW8190261.1 hypothetical protein [Pseudobdellovibrionaceae bacterium]